MSSKKPKNSMRKKFEKFKEKRDRTLKRRKLKRKVYKKQKCAFVDKSGKRCWRLAIGKGVLCEKHGGLHDNEHSLVPMERTEEYLSTLVNTKFKPNEHPVKFIDYSREGLSEVEIAAQFEVGVNTVQKWAETYEIFNTAYEIGKALYESWWLQQGKEALYHKSFNTKLFKFLTGNKLGYSDKVETKSMNMNVHGVLVVPAKVSEDEWEEEATKSMENVTDATYTIVDDKDA